MLKLTSAIFVIVCARFVFGDVKEIYVEEADVPELRYLNLSADPCDNFYAFTCGNFKNIHPLPENQLLWDHFTILQQDIHDLLKVILQSEREDDDPQALQKAKIAYKSCLGVDYEDLLDLPEKEVLNKLEGWPVIETKRDLRKNFSWYDIADIMAEFGIHIFFTYSIIPNLLNASENVIYISDNTDTNSSLIRPIPPKNVDIFDDFDPLPLEVFLKKVAYKLRDELGTFKTDENISEDISKTIAFMKTEASGGIVDVDSITSLSSVITLERLQNWTDANFDKTELQLDWVEYFSRVFRLAGVEISSSTKILQSGMTSKLYGILNLVKQTDSAVLKDFAIAKLLLNTAQDSNSYMREALEEYYIEKNIEILSRDQYCLSKIIDYPTAIGLSMALTYEYQRYHFNVNHLQNAAEMVEDLQEAFLEVLEESEWMDNSTKAQAKIKAENMITLLAYPDFVEDKELLDKYYENLRMCGWDHFGNSQRLRAFRQALNYAEIGNARDRTVWNISPLYTNAYYNGQNNRMLFPVAMLNPVFFTGEMSVLDYGRIGAIIGHEITHGFDNAGRSYNSEGTVSNWWTEATTSAYQERAQCFVEQYSKYYIEEIDAYVNGQTSLNENLADNGGLKDAFKAFNKLKRRRSPLKTVSNYTFEQLFFIGFGTMWCSTETNSYLESLVNSAYAPARFRVNGAVSNMEEFAAAFNCPVGSNMNPVDKCTLW